MQNDDCHPQHVNILFAHQHLPKESKNSMSYVLSHQHRPNRGEDRLFDLLAETSQLGLPTKDGALENVQLTNLPS